MEEVKQLLWRTKFEVETIRAAAQEEIGRKDEEINQLKELLNMAVRERENAVESYQSLLRQQRRIQQQDPTPTPPADDDGRSAESIVCESPAPEAFGRPLPEKGRLLQAVMKAGPLLQTLLLAGPLPQWRHPPPPLDGVEIPPVVVDSRGGRKRGGVGGSFEEGESALSAHLHPCMRPRSEVVCKPSPFLT